MSADGVGSRTTCDGAIHSDESNYLPDGAKVSVGESAHCTALPGALPMDSKYSVIVYALAGYKGTP